MVPDYMVSKEDLKFHSMHKKNVYIRVENEMAVEYRVRLECRMKK
jgi:hypothetical protein